MKNKDRERRKWKGGKMNGRIKVTDGLLERYCTVRKERECRLKKMVGRGVGKSEGGR